MLLVHCTNVIYIQEIAENLMEFMHMDVRMCKTDTECVQL